MEALSDVLQSLRLESSLICRARLTAPWGLATAGNSIAIFHAVVQGRCWLRLEGNAPLQLEPGDLAILPHGSDHIMADAPATPAAPIRTLPARDDGSGVRLLEHGGGGGETRIICGSFRLAHAGAGMLWSLLPPIMHIRQGRGRSVEWLDTTLELIGHELDHHRPGGPEIVARLTDILFIQALRTWLEEHGTDSTGWLGAFRDAQIARAIASIHREPGADWTADRLAARAGMSRSSFFARFSALVGEPPAQYLVRWRMQTAIDLMERESLSSAEVAERIGYASEDAFSKAFRRCLGLTPSAYRRSRANPSAGQDAGRLEAHEALLE